MRVSLSKRQIWLMPLLIGMISAAGLLAALLFDGWGDVLSWLLLTVPILVVVHLMTASP